MKRRRTARRWMLQALVMLALLGMSAAARAQPAPDSAGEPGDGVDDEAAPDSAGEPDAEDAPLTEDGRPAVGRVPPELVALAPAYPEAALAEGIEDAVLLVLYIDEAGQVVRVEVAQPAEHPEYGFEAAAIEAIERSVFLPALVDGAPTKAKIEFPYLFVYDEAAPVGGQVGAAPPPDGAAPLTEDGRPAVGSVLPELVALAPAYPEAALAEGIEDSVLLSLYIDETGRVVRAEVLEPAANPGYGFEAAALEAIERSTFLPGLVDGAPTRAKAEFRYEFFIEEPAVDEPPPPPPVNFVLELRERGTRKEVDEAFVSLQRLDDAGQPVGEPVEGVAIDGRFEGRGLEPGTWSVLVEADAYGRYEEREQVPEGQKVTATYYIEREYYEVFNPDESYTGDSAYVYQTDEVQQVRREINVQTLEVAEIQRVPGNQGDALKVVQNLPGVARPAFNGGAIVVRGAAPEDTEVLLDGAPIPLLYHFGGLSAVVNSDVLSQINFIPGNYSVRYGRALGGIVDVRTRRPSKERYSGYIDVDLIDASMLLEGPIGGGVSFQASARRSYIDAILPAVLPEDAGLDLTVAPRYWDYQLRLNWGSDERLGNEDRDPVHEVEAFSLGSDDVLEFVLEEPAGGAPSVRGSAEASTSFHHGQVTYTYRGDRIENVALYNLGEDRVNFALGDTARFELVTLNHAVRDELTIQATDWLDVVAGLDIRFGTFDVSVLAPQPPQEGETGGGFNEQAIEAEISGAFYQPAAFTELVVAPLDALLVSLGARVDYDRTIAAWSNDWRGAARYQLDRYWTLKAGVGSFHQAPQPNESTEAFGNPDLGFEQAIHYTAGVEARMPFYEALFVDVTGFYKRLSDLVASSDRIIERDGQLVEERVANTGTGDIYGAELLVRHDLANNFFGWIAYTLSRSERRDAPGEPARLFSFDQTHILTLVASYKLPRNWQVGLRWRYVTGSPYTPDSRGAYNADTDDYDPLPGETNSARVGAFHQLDLRVDKSWIFDTWILNLYLDVQNVYYRSNPEEITYNFDYTESAVVTGLPILPSIGIRGQF